MRGKDVYTPSFTAVLRITPAYAGKRQITVHSVCSSQDHPRLCGEKRIAFTITSVMKGSPPPMRGKVPDRGVNRFQIGITPAYAGKSHGTASRCGSRQDHPRLCGEKNKHHTAAVGIAGSPPPMRGKGCNYIIRLFAYGITPAYAGKRLSKNR